MGFKPDKIKYYLNKGRSSCKPTEIVDEYAQSDEFFDLLYSNTEFDVGFDDYRKWVEIKELPDAEFFKEDILEFAERYLDRSLNEYDREDLILCWNREYDRIINDIRTNLCERYSDDCND